jgi:chromosome segregation and condensation protein ScpB/DNA-binding XRE family transcriptional regulator
VDRTAVPSEQDREAEIELSGVAAEIRQRRKLLGLSQVQLAEVSHVSRTVINKVEQGARVPSIRTYARLRASLGLEAPPAALIPAPVRTRLDGDLVAALSAGLLMTREVSLGELASALDLAIPAVRENLDRVAERLHGVGFSLTEDGGTVRLWPLAGAPSEVVRALTVTEEDTQASPEQVQILGLVAYFGQMTRALIEHFRHEDSASVLDRMVKRGLLAKVRSDRGVGSPNIYRVTAKALRAAGYSTVEAMRAVIQANLSAAEQMSLANERGEQVDAVAGAGRGADVSDHPVATAATS